MLLDSDMGESLGEDVSDHLPGRKEVCLDLATLDNVVNPMPLDINVLHATIVTLRSITYR